jgi:hypothetical protein
MAKFKPNMVWNKIDRMNLQVSEREREREIDQTYVWIHPFYNKPFLKIGGASNESVFPVYKNYMSNLLKTHNLLHPN